MGQQERPRSRFEQVALVADGGGHAPWVRPGLEHERAATAPVAIAQRVAEFFVTQQRLQAENSTLRAELLDTARVPASIVTDASGRVLLARWGAPTVSEIRELLWRMRPAD